MDFYNDKSKDDKSKDDFIDLFKKYGGSSKKKMGLSKTEISKKMKEHDEKCLGNCVKIIQDKDLMKQIMRSK